MICPDRAGRIELGNSCFFSFQGRFLSYPMVNSEIVFRVGGFVVRHKRPNFLGVSNSK